MRFIYPAILKELPGGTWHARFPDLAMCEAEGDSVDEALRNANLAAHDWIALELEEEDPELPPSSHPEDLETGPDEMVRNVLVIHRMQDGWEE